MQKNVLQGEYKYLRRRSISHNKLEESGLSLTNYD